MTVIDVRDRVSQDGVRTREISDGARVEAELRDSLSEVLEYRQQLISAKQRLRQVRTWLAWIAVVELLGAIWIIGLGEYYMRSLGVR